MNNRPDMDKLDQLWKRGRDFLGVRFAILGGAMSCVSEHNLVAAISNAGGFGVLAGGSLTIDELAKEIEGTKVLTAKPFGVNLINMHPRLDDLIDMCHAAAISHIVLAAGLPKARTIARIKDGGAKAITFSPSVPVAKRMIRNGIDALVIEGAEAGGHIGPVSTSVLAQEMLPLVDAVPVFVAGGIGRGEAIVSYLEMGAAGVQLGTRFVCAKESIAHPNFKRAFIQANAREAMPTVQLDPRFPVIPVRALLNKGSLLFTQFQRDIIARTDRGELDIKQAQMEIEHFWAGALRKAVYDGDIENGSLMAGQSVGMVNSEQPTQEIIAELVSQARTALDARG